MHRKADDLLRRVEYMERKRRFYELAKQRHQAQHDALQKCIISVKAFWA